MKNVKAPNLIVALSLMLMLTACGKSMNLQVEGQKSEDAAKVDEKSPDASNKLAPATAACSPDAVVTKIATEALQDWSKTDLEEMKDYLGEGQLAKRAIVQIAPAEATTDIAGMELVLKNAVIGDLDQSAICTQKSCYLLKSHIKDPKAEEIHVNLMDVFELSGKSLEEKLKWIDENSSEFATPGYRKFRFVFNGISSIEGGGLIIQSIADDKKLSADFATAPSCYLVGKDDRESAVSAPAAPAEDKKSEEGESCTDEEECKDESAQKAADGVMSSAAKIAEGLKGQKVSVTVAPDNGEASAPVAEVAPAAEVPAAPTPAEAAPQN